MPVFAPLIRQNNPVRGDFCDSTRVPAVIIWIVHIKIVANSNRAELTDRQRGARPSALVLAGAGVPPLVLAWDELVRFV